MVSEETLKLAELGYVKEMEKVVAAYRHLMDISDVINREREHKRLKKEHEEREANQMINGISRSNW